jgi:hypothetical protein
VSSDCPKLDEVVAKLFFSIWAYVMALSTCSRVSFGLCSRSLLCDNASIAQALLTCSKSLLACARAPLKASRSGRTRRASLQATRHGSHTHTITHTHTHTQ